MDRCHVNSINDFATPRRAITPAPVPHLPRRLWPQREEISKLAVSILPRAKHPISLAELFASGLPTIVGQGDTPATFERHFGNAFMDIFPRLVEKRSLRLEDILTCHAALAPEAPQGLRKSSVHCGGRDVATAVYLPPPAATLDAYMKDLLLFIKEDAPRLKCWFMPALVTAIQLILVHPFLEGNGRTARALFAIIACRHSGCDREIVTALQNIWAAESLLIEALSSRISQDGWRRNVFVNLESRLWS